MGANASNRLKVWCAWCGDDIEPNSGSFCNKKCEREYWRDVYREGLERAEFERHMREVFEL
jgi:hypothetical protein